MRTAVLGRVERDRTRAVRGRVPGGFHGGRSFERLRAKPSEDAGRKVDSWCLAVCPISLHETLVSRQFFGGGHPSTVPSVHGTDNVSCDCSCAHVHCMDLILSLSASTRRKGTCSIRVVLEVYRPVTRIGNFKTRGDAYSLSRQTIQHRSQLS